MRSRVLVALSIAVLCHAAIPVYATTLTINPGRSLRMREVANVGTPINDAISPADNTNRMFVVQQNGSIRIVKNGALLTTAFLTSANIPNFGSFGGETGLLGLAFHPNYANVGAAGFGKFYTFSSQSKQGNADFFNNTDYGGGQQETLTAGGGTFQNVVREFTVTNPAADVFSGTSRVVMSIAKATGNHNGGGIAFGTAPGDTNNLYIALGDGGHGNDNDGGDGANDGWADFDDGHTNFMGNGQDKNVVYGKILRINPILDGNAANNGANGQYDIPSSNPFVGAAGLDEIFAYGFRNPFRISLDRLTGILYTGDVGQGLREEIDRVVSGGNYGWVNKEGTANTPSLPSGTLPIVGTAIDPIAEYPHPGGGAVIGGYINRGPELFNLLGYYIFGELTSKLYYLNPNDPAGQIFQFSIDTSAGGASLNAGVNGFGQDQDGRLYALLSNGRVLQLIPEPSTGVLAAAAIGCMTAIAAMRHVRRPHR